MDNGSFGLAGHLGLITAVDINHALLVVDCRAVELDFEFAGIGVFVVQEPAMVFDCPEQVKDGALALDEAMLQLQGEGGCFGPHAVSRPR